MCVKLVCTSHKNQGKCIQTSWYNETSWLTQHPNQYELKLEMALTFNILDFTFSFLGRLTMLIKQDHLGRNFTAFLIAIPAVYIRTPWPTQMLVLIVYNITCCIFLYLCRLILCFPFISLPSPPTVPFISILLYFFVDQTGHQHSVSSGIISFLLLSQSLISQRWPNSYVWPGPISFIQTHLHS